MVPAGNKVNRLSSVNHTTKKVHHRIIKDNSNNNEQLQKKRHKGNNVYISKNAKNKHLETFINIIEKLVFKPRNIKRVRSNTTCEEGQHQQFVGMQDKGCRFLLLTNED